MTYACALVLRQVEKQSCAVEMEELESLVARQMAAIDQTKSQLQAAEQAAAERAEAAAATEAEVTTLRAEAASMAEEMDRHTAALVAQVQMAPAGAKRGMSYAEATPNPHSFCVKGRAGREGQIDRHSATLVCCV